ncbi:hypothetical protein DERF_009019 [Dermatophagoides farinae]|uniref:Uncharacterized protein n=1 Tax=Dermatophagoides farinae TaxID=6954 RepID=A0A922HWF5_DERFA|nr:hypothetical protein DERF_009019 [Dermatophagoides farinae]
MIFINNVPNKRASNQMMPKLIIQKKMVIRFNIGKNTIKFIFEIGNIIANTVHLHLTIVQNFIRFNQ